jgi:hypothetical protein
MSPHHGRSLPIHASLLLAILCGSILLASASAGFVRAEPAPVWIPAGIGIDREGPIGDLYYDGLAGRLVGVDPSDAGALVARGARQVDVGTEESLWVYLVEDAGRAQFEPQTRVLLRAGHEVFLATDGATPQLTRDSAASMKGMQQVVRINRIAMPWPEGEPAPRATERTVDPMIQAMVNDLTQANLDATWQALDDFEVRYTLATQNQTATQWMLDQFRSFGIRANFHLYQQSGTRRNVVATIPGLVDSTKVVYICGHLDSTSDTPSVCSPGADDNGSGTAAVIEAARVLSQYQFQYTIKFALFNGEEQGLLGSAAYAADIAAAGENVIAVYNCDMVAYRGTDPAPPDMVIYTNTASQSVATILSTAVNDYVPGLIEPVVVVEALTGSDHASFWNHGYKAVCAIEDEAWGSDFCPWYHTCNDRIERYPHDYILNCTKANLAAVATSAIPFQAQGSFLTMGSVLVDDDLTGGSNGNGDGEANPGETIELWVTIRNLGQAAATNVGGVLSSTSGHVTILDSSSAWHDIPASGQGANLTALRFSVSPSVVDGENLPFVLTMTDDTGPQTINFSLPAAAPLLGYRAHGIDDVTSGNGNGVPDPGEILLIPVTLGNTGGQDAASVAATLTTTSPHVTILDGSGTVAMIASGATGALAPAYRIAVSGLAIDGEILPLNLSITAGFGYAAQSSFNLKVGSFFYDEVETDTGWSLAATDDTATLGRWVRVDPIGTIATAGGQAQPEDDHTPAPGTICFVTGQGTVGGGPGEADVDGGKTTLRSPVFDLTHVLQPRVVYWRWYTNNLGNNPGEDTWLVQVSNNGGTSWADLERTTASANNWQQKSFLIESYVPLTGQIVFRFVAEDVGAGGSLVEAAIDDFEIEGVFSPVDAAEAAQSLSLRLDAARPNPAAGSTTISYAIPAGGSATLAVFGVDGRRVRTLVDAQAGPGSYHVVWDGRNEAGQVAAPGVYFYKLSMNGREITRRLTLLR